jgi:CheY-like chemotaxis protein
MKTVLFVDRLSFCRELFSLALQRTGYEIVTASDGIGALDIMKNQAPDLVILDARLPNVDGLSVVRVMRSIPELKDVPVFMLTALDDHQHMKQALASGVQEYILKGQFSLTDILTRMAKYIGGGGAGAPINPSVELWEPIDAPLIDEMPMPEIIGTIEEQTAPSSFIRATTAE